MPEQANRHNSIWPTQADKFAPSDQHKSGYNSHSRQVEFFLA